MTCAGTKRLVRLSMTIMDNIARGRMVEISYLPSLSRWTGRHLAQPAFFAFAPAHTGSLDKIVQLLRVVVEGGGVEVKQIMESHSALHFRTDHRQVGRALAAEHTS